MFWRIFFHSQNDLPTCENAGVKIILAGGKIILEGGKIILAGGKIISAGVLQQIF